MVRFGPYVVRPTTRTVLRNGLRVRLYGQSFEILLMLLERDGEVVTREELKKRLWPNDTFVDFDHGLNAAMRNLRRALGDSPEAPKYIETIPRMGYRLIATITRLDVGESTFDIKGEIRGGRFQEPSLEAFTPDGKVELLPQSFAGAIATGPTTPIELPRASPAPRRVGIKWLIGAAIAVAGLAAIAGVYVLRKSPPVPPVVRIRQLTQDVHPAPNADLVLCGDRIYLLATENAANMLASVPLSGGPVEYTPPPFKQMEILGASPNGGELLLSRMEMGFPNFPMRRTLWRYFLATREVRRVGSMFVYDAAWLPDGRGILFSGDTDQTLNLIDPNGRNWKELARLPGTVNKIRFAPDGRTFRFSLLAPDSSITLWEYDLALNTFRRLLPGWEDSAAQWSGGWLAGSRYFAFLLSEAHIGTLWALPEPSSWFDRHGSKPVQLAGGSLLFMRPVTAPGGSSVYVVGHHDSAQLMRYDLKTKRYEPFLAGLSADQLTYSPDGKWMAYVTYPDHALVTSRVDGSERVQLTFSPLWPDSPRWSPDSLQLVFEAISWPDQNRSVYLVPAGRGTPRPLAPGSGKNQVGAQWSSDGQSVIFFTPAAQSEEAYAIHRFNWKTNTDTINGGFKNIHEGLFSPDGTHIAAGGGYPLIMHDIASDSNRILAPYAEFLRWSADSKYLVYSTLMNEWLQGKGKGGIYRVRIADGKTETIAPGPDFLLAGNWGAWMDFAPDGSPLVLKYTGNSDVYAVDVMTVGPK